MKAVTTATTTVVMIVINSLNYNFSSYNSYTSEHDSSRENS